MTGVQTCALPIWVVPPRFPPGDPNADAWIMLITVGVSTMVWVRVTYATPPESDRVLASFYQRVRPGGPGWAATARRLGLEPGPIPGGWIAGTNWVAGIVAVYASLFGIGKVIFGEVALGAGLLALATAAFLWIGRSFRAEAA